MKTEKNSFEELEQLLAAQQEALARATAYINQLQRTLWQAANQVPSKTILIEEADVPILWRLDKAREENGTIVLKASVTPPPSEEVMAALALKLRGTNLRIIDIAKEMLVDNWPAHYIEFQLSKTIIFVGGTWIDAALARQAAKAQDSQN